jgi:gliding motility-associated lipoprotein GldD
MRLKKATLIKFIWLWLPCLLIITSCHNDYFPKPRGYYRIDLPEKKYRVFDSIYPYTFEYPVYAKVNPKPDSLSSAAYWLNIEFPSFKGTIHLSYKVINGNLKQYIDDAYTLVNKHIPKANAIDEKMISRPLQKVYGMAYEIRGSDAASPYQFILTDSTRNFVRGALYFFVIPNNDSLAPVIDFVRKDIDHFIETFRWKEQ